MNKTLEDLFENCDRVKESGITALSPSGFVFSLSGFAGNGKSFFAKSFYNYLMGTTEHSIFLYEEPARMIKRIYREFGYTANHTDKNWSLTMVAFQVSNLKNFSEIHEEITKREETKVGPGEMDDRKVVAIFDRFLFDEIAYAVIRGAVNLSDAKDFLFELSDDYLHLGNLVVLFEPIKNEKVIEKLLSDPLRKEVFGTVERFMELQGEFYEVYKELFSVWKERCFSTEILRVPSISEEPHIGMPLIGCLLHILKR